MRKMIPGCALVLLGIAFSASAQAPWKWRDASGQINYSDQPPPVAVPAAWILSMGGQRRGAAGQPAVQPENAEAPRAGSPTASAADVPDAPPAAGEPGAAADSPERPRTAAARLVERRKQQAEKEAAERKAKEQKQLEARVAQWCDDLRGRERLLESGMRVARVDASGEKAYVDDEEREAQLSSVRSDLGKHCRAGS